MARPRTFTQEELLAATERLLIEHGYSGFHLKMLSEHLGGARSTIYGYYANKEEIVAACMRRSMEKILAASDAWVDTEPATAIRQLFNLFLKQSNFHRLMQEAPKSEQVTSPKAKRDLQYVDQGHELLKKRLMSLFQHAQQTGAIRTDIPLPVIVAVYFHAIDTPNWLGLPDEAWADHLFSLWWNGSRNFFSSNSTDMSKTNPRSP